MVSLGAPRQDIVLLDGLAQDSGVQVVLLLLWASMMVSSGWMSTTPDSHSHTHCHSLRNNWETIRGYVIIRFYCLFKYTGIKL